MSQTVSVDARYLRRPDVGISVYLRGIIDALIGGGVPITLLTDGADHAAVLREQFGQPVVAFPEPSGLRWEQLELRRYLAATRPRMHIAGANWGLPLGARRGTRLVLVVLDLVPLRMPRTYLTHDPAWTAKYLVSISAALLAADAFVVCSHATAADVRRVAGRRPVLVRYPLEETLKEPGPRLDGWPDRYLLYHGGRDPRKNLDVLLEGFARYRADGGNRELVLMGSGYEVLRPRIEALGISSAVALPGFVPDADKASAIAHADAVLYPSRFEGYGLPVLEAIQLGVPVVSGTGGSLREIGGDLALHVDTDDAGALARAIPAALDPALRERIRRDGPAHVRAITTRPDADPLLDLLA